jgi:hypothetical protein
VPSRLLQGIQVAVDSLSGLKTKHNVAEEMMREQLVVHPPLGPKLPAAEVACQHSRPCRCIAGHGNVHRGLDSRSS